MLGSIFLLMRTSPPNVNGHWGRGVFCLLLGLHLCSDLTANWSLMCVLYKKKNSAYIIQQNVYCLVLLCTVCREQLPCDSSPLGNLPCPPLHLCAHGECLRDVEIFRDELKNLFSTFLFNWKELKCWQLAFEAPSTELCVELAVPTLL